MRTREILRVARQDGASAGKSAASWAVDASSDHAKILRRRRPFARRRQPSVWVREPMVCLGIVVCLFLIPLLAYALVEVSR